MGACTHIYKYTYRGDRMSRVGGRGFLPCTWSCLTLNSLFLLVTKSLITPLATVKNTLRFYNQTPLRAPEFATVTHFQPIQKVRRARRYSLAYILCIACSKSVEKYILLRTASSQPERCKFATVTHFGHVMAAQISPPPFFADSFTLFTRFTDSCRFALTLT